LFAVFRTYSVSFAQPICVYVHTHRKKPTFPLNFIFQNWGAHYIWESIVMDNTVNVLRNFNYFENAPPLAYPFQNPNRQMCSSGHNLYPQNTYAF